MKRRFLLTMASVVVLLSPPCIYPAIARHVKIVKDNEGTRNGAKQNKREKSAAEKNDAEISLVAQVGHYNGVGSVAISSDGKYTLTQSRGDYTALLWETESGREIRRFGNNLHQVACAAVTSAAKYVVTGSSDKTVRLWDVESGKEVRRFEGHTAVINAVSITSDDRYVVTGSGDSTTRFWDASTGKELCRLISLRDGTWAVVSPDGRFDAGDLEEIRELHWFTSDERLKPLPLEIFMRDYYEPRLLSRILSGERFKEIRRLSGLNRVQPLVKIAGIERQKDNSDLVTVAVEVAKGKSERQRDKDNHLWETGVYDLRLFRDGQIVGQYTDGKPQVLPRSANDNKKLLAWQKENEIRLDANGRRTIKFENIKLPQSAGEHEVQFTAYAFNEDRVKSETAKTDQPFTYEVAKEKGCERRAYVITVGVNAYENPTFDLKYSVNDAKAIQQAISERLSKCGDYADIVQVARISNSKQVGSKRELIENTATKRNFKAVLDLLDGRPVDAETKKQIPNADKLRQANPEDLILISFSSHGYADNNGNFFFVLSDTGPSTGEQITETLLQKLSAKFLSSEELSQWLRDVDGGEMLLIVDACHSAAAVQGQEFKPGPMGSRGLGLLSYDKGMRILTATQAADVAYGSGALKQGLLTYVLVKDGIEAGKADFKPADKRITVSEWLEYGEQDVPKLLEEASLKAKQAEAPVELKDLVQKTLSDLKTQRPSLFDFSRKRAEVVLVRP